MQDSNSNRSFLYEHLLVAMTHENKNMKLVFCLKHLFIIIDAYYLYSENEAFKSKYRSI